jgi:NADPH:quinone reductase-like Zn-dependent oxidoreductase
MKAAVYKNYGPPEVVRIAEIDKPVPKDDEVLIKVRAASVNPLDWRIMNGKPFAVRVMAALTKMKGHPGVDAAGEVEAVGKNVTQFKPGDAVFGACRGAFAEYTCGNQTKIAMKPDNVTFEQAASINVAGLTALQGLRDHGKVKKGGKVLVNGAAGGVGAFAVQIGKSFGAHVTGVCSTRNIELVRSIGADDVIDYNRNDFTSSNQRYDLILDCVGNHSFSACKRVLNPEGRSVIIGGPHDISMTALFARMLKTALVSLFGKKKAVMFIAKASQADLTVIGELIASGKIKPVIDKVYSLNESAAAIRHVEEGHARGKVIISLDQA